MNHLQPPALLAYRAGELISTLVELEEQVGRGKITVTSIEHLLKRYLPPFFDNRRNLTFCLDKTSFNVATHYILLCLNSRCPGVGVGVESGYDPFSNFLYNRFHDSDTTAGIDDRAGPVYIQMPTSIHAHVDMRPVQSRDHA